MTVFQRPARDSASQFGRISLALAPSQREYVGQLLHGRTKTTLAIQKAIQRSTASIAVLAEKCDLNPKTVTRWRARESVEDPLTIRLLKLFNGDPSRPTFSEALAFYIDEDVKGTHDQALKITRFNHVLDLVVNALGRDPHLDDSVKRADGRTVRDCLLESVSPA